MNGPTAVPTGLSRSISSSRSRSSSSRRKASNLESQWVRRSENSVHYNKHTMMYHLPRLLYLVHLGCVSGVLPTAISMPVKVGSSPGQPFICLCFVLVIQVVIPQVQLLDCLEVPHGWWHPHQHVVGCINTLDTFQPAHAAGELPQTVC